MLNKLYYPCTNETLEGVIYGLNLNSEDNVLTIAGSGDQAFAILEYARRVTAIDHNLAQITYMKERMKHLKKGKFKKFLSEDDLTGFTQGFVYDKLDRDRYFRQPIKRLRRIRANINNLSLVLGDVCNTIQGDSIFSKIYMSNMDSVPKNIVQVLKKNGLIYFTLNPPKEELGKELIMDEELTSIARKFKKGPIWNPVVYRKVS